MYLRAVFSKHTSSHGRSSLLFRIARGLHEAFALAVVEPKRHPRLQRRSVGFLEATVLVQRVRRAVRADVALESLAGAEVAGQSTVEGIGNRIHGHLTRVHIHPALLGALQNDVVRVIHDAPLCLRLEAWPVRLLMIDGPKNALVSTSSDNNSDDNSTKKKPTLERSTRWARL